MSDRNRKIKSIAVFALPVVLTKLVAVVLLDVPAKAGADLVPAVAATTVPRLDGSRDWTAVQKAAAAHIVFLRTQPFGPTPLLHGDVNVVVDRTPVNPQSAPHATLGAILDAGPDSVAYFDGKRHKVGDPLLGSAWTVHEINGAARSVTVRHRDTEEEFSYTLSVPGR